MRVIFGEYRPDQPAHLQDGLLTAEGVYPIANGYAPLGSFSAASNGTLAAACLGAGAYRASGTVFLFAATSSHVYRYATSGYTSIKSGLTTSATVGMRFCPYNELMLMTNGSDPIQKFNPVSPLATSDLDAGAPTARFIGRIGGFLIAAYADDDPLAFQCSGNGDPAEWTPGTLDSALFILSGGGDITGFVGGEEYGLLFQEERIIRLVPTGDDAVFDQQEVSVDIGCTAPWSLASYGKLSFFLSNKGLMVCDGVSVQPIGEEKIDRTFLSLVDQSYIDHMSAVVDPSRSLLMVSAPSSNPTNKVFIYNYALQRWSMATMMCERMFSSLGQGIALDSLDMLYGNVDAVPLSLDSNLFRGGYPAMMLFDGSHRLGALTGPAMAATLKGPLQELFEGCRARIRSVRPLCDASTLTVTVGTADALSDELTASDCTSRSGGGYYRMRQSGNLSQVTLSIAAGADWSHVQGYDIEARPGGRA